ncbi:hypothetical protein [Desulfopila sp. IMCC35008]|uniref:hypothetical protein n=1 Tax=Desulfopila sp. IMCC35008 TaxID=2653858 RepID=UPI0013D0CCEF|nr:hypothetical protein [Desulfopila sp. IMCC35008]
MQSYAHELPDHWQQGLEAGVNWGLAASYPNDIGITANAHVLAVEDFETGTVTIETEEDRYLLNTNVVSTHAYTGKHSGEHRWAQGYNGPTTRYQIPEEAHQGERPTYFVRMCFMFDDSFRPQDGQSGVGVKGFGVFSDPTNSSSTNTPCDGTNWYNAQAQFVGWGLSSKPQANDGYLWVGHLYSYNPSPETAVPSLGTIRISDPPVGNVPYRFSSYADPFSYIDFGGWHCYEVGLYLNTPGEDDGEARFWIDGVLQSRVTNMRYRDIEGLYPTDMHLNLHRTTDNYPQTMIRWTDNIVLATRYIGPVRRVEPNLERAVSALQVLTGKEKEGDELHSDINGDGKISIDDSIIMLRIAAASR